MKQVATKTPADGVTAPTGFTVFHVKTVLLDDEGEKTGEFEEHYEVCDDTNGLPIASDFDKYVAVDKAKAVVEFLRRLKEGDTLKLEGSSSVVKGPGVKQKPI